VYFRHISTGKLCNCAVNEKNERAHLSVEKLWTRDGHFSVAAASTLRKMMFKYRPIFRKNRCHFLLSLLTPHCMHLLYYKKCSASFLCMINGHQFNFLSKQLSLITQEEMAHPNEVTEGTVIHSSMSYC